VIGDLIQPTHLIFILVIALIFLGPKRLPEAGRALGRGIRDFRGAMSGLEEHMDLSAATADAPAASADAPTAPSFVPAPVVSADPAAEASSGDEHLTAATVVVEDPSPVADGIEAPAFDEPGDSTGSVRAARDAMTAPATRAARAEVEVADPSDYSD
jgi:sec-independent protein translocase protein TatA